MIQIKASAKKVTALLLCGVLIATTLLLTGCGKEDQIVIGTQTFTESKIMAEMYKALIEEQTDLQAKVIPDLAASAVIINAMKKNEVHMATLYSGELFNNHFPVEETKDRQEVLKQAQAGFDKYLGFTWMDSLGFENTYAFTVQSKLAEERGYERISDVVKDAGDLRLGVDTTWMERTNDGYPAFRKAYNVEFGQAFPMEQSLVYEAVGNNQVDIVLAYSTDSRIKAYDLKTLEDDKQFFPPYDASPVLLKELAQKHPEVVQAIQPLIGTIDEQTMIDLNYKVDIEKKSEREVAIEYLEQQGLLVKKNEK
ncbi:glycine betaine ABC transporter substrate-binding protein [Paenibacillus assamensis]|uniref:glycine betaine ABC transporter substrate-binding protein n=1 Tax=Paenibacillus assamensis TaxID=311244 RepID=UPI0004145E06|nr:glycine betaine ABC transporter substrate-binding protein [Paenibacillus assamensis]